MMPAVLCKIQLCTHTKELKTDQPGLDISMLIVRQEPQYAFMASVFLMPSGFCSLR